MAGLKKEKILNIVFFAYLAIFPFGQLLHGFYLADILVLIIAAYSLFAYRGIWGPKGKFLTLVLLGSFSLAFSLGFFKLSDIATGIAYFVRLVSYVLLFFFVRQNYKSPKERDLLFGSLIIISLAVALFGFAQYFFMPDLRFLKTIGWDDHYFRLVSTFLDPTFTGIILLAGLILALAKKHYFLGLINLVAIALTYSRSTYLALAVSLGYFFLLTKRKIFLIFPLLLLIAIPFLPRPSSEGVKLERTYSVFQKFGDYKKAIIIFSKSPIFGIGFDNVCLAKQAYFEELNPQSHSCSGIDNSILLVLATTGIAGVILLIEVLAKAPWKSVAGVVLVAVLVHSLFTNTLFYPFVMGLLAILLAISDNSDLYSTK